MAALDKFSGQVTAEEVFFRAMLNISQLATNIYSTTTTEWQRNALNFEQAINTLEALAAPFLSEDYDTAVREARTKYREIYRRRKQEMTKPQLVKAGHDLEVKLTLKIANMRLRLIQEDLHTAGIFFSRTYQAIEPEEEEQGGAAVDDAAVAGLDVPPPFDEDEDDDGDDDEAAEEED